MSDSTAWSEYSRFFIALLGVLDPLAAIPIFLDLTRGYSAVERARTARITSLSVAVVLIVSALLGESVLAVFGTSVGAFRVGGGIVVLLMALSMLQAQPTAVRQTPEELREAGHKEAVAVVPLGIPLLAGPGAIGTVVIQMDRGTGWLHTALVLLCIAAVIGVCFGVLRFADRVGRWLGPLGLNIAIRLIGLVLAAIAIEYIVNGLVMLLPGLAGPRAG